MHPFINILADLGFKSLTLFRKPLYLLVFKNIYIKIIY
jgi:hypothetical protein